MKGDLIFVRPRSAGPDCNVNCFSARCIKSGNTWPVPAKEISLNARQSEFASQVRSVISWSSTAQRMAHDYELTTSSMTARCYRLFVSFGWLTFNEV